MSEDCSDSPPEALLLGPSCDSLCWLGEVLPLCFLFLLVRTAADLPLLGRLLLRGPDVIVAGVALPFCISNVHIHTYLQV